MYFDTSSFVRFVIRGVTFKGSTNLEIVQLFETITIIPALALIVSDETRDHLRVIGVESEQVKLTVV